jgi:putative nucleotidyltransferase with HDIG domain
MNQGRSGPRQASTTEHELDPTVQRLVEEARDRQALGLVGRERRAEIAIAAGFVVAATAAALLLPSDGGLSLPLAAASMVAYALAARVEFYTGAGWSVPTQLVFVPMLFAVPTPAVPLLVAGALLLAKAPEYLSGEVRAERAVIAIGDAWYALGPVLVLSLAGAGGPAWADWPIYLAALAAQFGLDLLVSTIRGRLGLGLALRAHLRELGLVYAVDALLAPIGLLAAFASAGQTYAFLLVLPLVGLLAIFAREREARIENALTLSQAYRGTALLLSELLSERDEYTGAHSRSVVVLSSQVARVMGLGERQVRNVEFGALLHDVGKMSIPKTILDKPGPLSDEEFAVIKGHTRVGEDMLTRIGGVLAEAGYVVRTHHERYDGDGYPDGLAGEEIPVSARIIACCDAFNAMITDRPYREAISVAAALRELRANAGSQFDPRVAQALVEIIERCQHEADIDAEGTVLAGPSRTRSLSF